MKRQRQGYNTEFDSQVAEGQKSAQNNNWSRGQNLKQSFRGNMNNNMRGAADLRGGQRHFQTNNHQKGRQQNNNRQNNKKTYNESQKGHSTDKI